MPTRSARTSAAGRRFAYTRRGNDWTRQFRSIADAVAKLPAKRAIIDGEAVVLAENGIADFPALRGALDGSTRLRLYAFDLLMLDGQDLRERPLLERKARLRKLLAGGPPALVYVDHMTGDSVRILSQACRLGGPKRCPIGRQTTRAWDDTRSMTAESRKLVRSRYGVASSVILRGDALRRARFRRLTGWR